MALVTLNGDRVVRATVWLPVSGRWTLQAQLDAKVFTATSLSLDAPGMKLTGGTVRRSAIVLDSVHVLGVGGKAGLARELAPKAYRVTTVGLIVADILREAGETLATTAHTATLGRGLSSWMRHRGTAAVQLDTLLAHVGAYWRLTDAGAVWVGVDTWPTVTPNYVLTGPDRGSGRTVIAAETAELRPGTTFLGRKVLGVRHTFEASRFRTEVEHG